MTAAPRLWQAIAATGLAGCAVMAAELTAVRILAPHFGDSSYVWTNVIGIILAALAAGAWWGGRLSAGPAAALWPRRLLVSAGLLIAGAPLVAGPLGGWLLPAELPLDAAMPAIVRGSFVATALLFVPPMLLLGAVSPLLVTVTARSGVPVGRAAGSIGAAGTLGSLVGTFAATHWLVPEFGCRMTMTLTGGLLIMAGIVVAGSRRAVVGSGAVALLVALAATQHGGPLRPPFPGRELLAERESRCQFLQVQREVMPSGGRRTMLVVNEGLDSFHSLYIDDSSLTGGAYYDWHALAPLLVGDGRRPEPLRALSIGDAAGSLRTVYAGCHPGATVDGVDIDAACGELGAAWFGTKKAPGSTFVVDGRVFLERARATWHVIHVDAYAHQVYVPAHLASREFFAAARARLEPGGMIACNIGALHGEDPVLASIGRSLAAEFGHAWALPVPDSRNFVLVARNGAAPDPTSLQGFAFGAERLSSADQELWRKIVETGSRPAMWRDVSGKGEILVDDRPVLDRLLLASYVDRQDPGVVVVCAGAVDVAGAELTAFGHAQTRRWHDVLAAVQSSRSPSVYLRELAGDSRWSLRQLASAVAEYAAALELTADANVQERLRGKIIVAGEEQAPIQLAERVARRNGWLEVGACVALVLALAVLRTIR